MIIDNLSNQAWLIANNKEQEFETLCKEQEIPSANPWSLHFYINKIKRAEEERKMTSSFSNFNGFFVEWYDQNCGPCRVFNKSEKEARELFANLKSKMVVELFKLENGKLEKIG